MIKIKMIIASWLCMLVFLQAQDTNFVTMHVSGLKKELTSASGSKIISETIPFNGGRDTKESTYDKNGALVGWINTKYNFRDDVIEISNQLGNSSSFNYDRFGKLLSSTNQLGVTTLYDYSTWQSTSAIDVNDNGSIDIGIDVINKVDISFKTENNLTFKTVKTIEVIDGIEVVTKQVTQQFNTFEKEMVTILYPDLPNADKRTTTEYYEKVNEIGKINFIVETFDTTTKQEFSQDNLIKETITKNGIVISQKSFVYDWLDRITSQTNIIAGKTTTQA